MGKTLNLASLDDTHQIADQLVTEYVPFLTERPLVIGINGPLGAGKTTLTQAIAAALDIAEPVTSPTYTYLEEYPFVFPGFKGMLYHLDAWRVDDQAVFDQLKIGNLVRPGNLLVVEWHDQVASWLEPTLVEQNARLIQVNLTEKDGCRQATIEMCDYVHTSDNHAP